MDTTVFKIVDYKTFYIHAVVDNYSRKIISYIISSDKTGKTIMSVLCGAVYNEFGVEIDFTNQYSLDGIVDGEANMSCATVKESIDICSSSDLLISQKVALQDIQFSNSVIEGAI